MQTQLQKRSLFLAANRMQGGGRSKMRRIRRQVAEDAGGQGDDGVDVTDSDEEFSSSLDDEEITVDSDSEEEDEDEQESDESATDHDNELLISNRDPEEEEKEAGEEHVRLRASTITKDGRGGAHVGPLNLDDDMRAAAMLIGDTPKYIGSPDRAAPMLNR